MGKPVSSMSGLSCRSVVVIDSSPSFETSQTQPLLVLPMPAIRNSS